MTLCVLLGGQVHTGGNINLPTNTGAFSILISKEDPFKEDTESDEAEVSQMYGILWQEQNRYILYVWYIGYCVANNTDGSYKTEHLHRSNKVLNLKWKNPQFPEIADVNIDNIF